MQKILLTTDLDARSDRALDRAIMISTALNAELYILHVVEKTWPLGAEKTALSEINNLVQISQNIHRVSKESQVLAPQNQSHSGQAGKRDHQGNQVN